jgi:hypothetical protein
MNWRDCGLSDILWLSPEMGASLPGLGTMKRVETFRLGLHIQSIKGAGWRWGSLPAQTRSESSTNRVGVDSSVCNHEYITPPLFISFAFLEGKRNRKMGMSTHDQIVMATIAKLEAQGVMNVSVDDVVVVEVETLDEVSTHKTYEQVAASYSCTNLTGGFFVLAVESSAQKTALSLKTQIANDANDFCVWLS